MKISPFTPLCFDPYISDGLPCRHIQVWSRSDAIMLQVCADVGETAPAGIVENAVSGSQNSITWQSWQMNADKVVYFATLSAMDEGYYRIIIDDMVSEVFRVTDDVLALQNTVLIRYRFNDNRQRDDVVSVIDGMPVFFEWRVPGGFKDSGWTFGVNNEQFATQREDLVELFAVDYITKTFTLGGPEGVPVWYGALLNRLLTCNRVFFDGVRYVRNESETPTMNTLVDGMDAFVFSQTLREVCHLEDDGMDGTVVLRNVSETVNRNINNSNTMIL